MWPISMAAWEVFSFSSASRSEWRSTDGQGSRRRHGS
jgi:hypothetical protein